MNSKILFASRPSALARCQTQQVIEQLRSYRENLAFEIRIITTKGDRVLDQPLPDIGGKGLFTSELEQALGEGQVHAAVHSLKDLPVETPPGLCIGAIPRREDPRDVLFSPGGFTLDELPAGAVVGTSSLRRQAQLLAYRQDLKIEPVRGNVDTRIRKAEQGMYDAIILAAAGLNRLGLESRITQYLPLDLMLPAPGQGALAVQCRSDDEATLGLLSAIHHEATQMAVLAERAFLAGLGGGCSLPVGAYAQVHQGLISLEGVIAAPDGSQIMRLSRSGREPLSVGHSLAVEGLEAGAEQWLAL